MNSAQNESDLYNSNSDSSIRPSDLNRPIKKGPRSLFKYLVLGLFIFIISFIAAVLLPETRSYTQVNLVQRAIDASDGLEPNFESNDVQVLTDFVQEQFQWDSRAPYITETALRGVAVHEIIDGVELPSYVYEDAHGGQITVYMISYRLLDERPDNLSIDDLVLKNVSEEYQLIAAPSSTGTQAVMWREYSFLFLAVSSNDTPMLITRINPKRSP